MTCFPADAWLPVVLRATGIIAAVLGIIFASATRLAVKQYQGVLFAVLAIASAVISFFLSEYAWIYPLLILGGGGIYAAAFWHVPLELGKEVSRERRRHLLYSRRSSS